MTARHTPPTEVDGTPVYAMGHNPTEHAGETWITLVPDDLYDERLWEFSLTTGRIVRTV